MLTQRELLMACADDSHALSVLEQLRWPDGPCCPRCGSVDVYRMRSGSDRNKRGLWRCRDCTGHDQFTVRTATVMERSLVPLRHWVFAFWQMSSCKRGVSALQFQRQTGLSYKSALSLLRRIRFAMLDAGPPILTGCVEVDETWVGGRPTRCRSEAKKHRPVHFTKRKLPVVALVERAGAVRVRVMPEVTAAFRRAVIRANVSSNSRIFTDGLMHYRGIARDFAGGHEWVNHHAGEYARGDVNTNTVESFFSVFKRGIRNYNKVSPQYMHCYAAEFEFRWNTRELTDLQRLAVLIRGILPIAPATPLVSVVRYG